MTLDASFWTDCRTQTLIDVLGRGTDGCALRILCLFESNGTADGELSGYTAQQIERIVGWTGKPGRLLEGMAAADWLEPMQDGAGWRCKRWEAWKAGSAAVTARALDMVAVARRQEREVTEALIGALERERDALAAALQQEQERRVERERKREQRAANGTCAGQSADSERDTAPSIDRSSSTEKNLKAFDIRGPKPETSSAPRKEGLKGEDRKDAFKNGQSPANATSPGATFTPVSEQYWRGIELEKGLEPGRPCAGSEMRDRALGMVRGLLQTEHDLEVAERTGRKNYCKELDGPEDNPFKGGGVWCKYAKDDAGALILACHELRESVEKRLAIDSKARLLNKMYQRHFARRMAALARREGNLEA